MSSYEETTSGVVVAVKAGHVWDGSISQEPARKRRNENHMFMILGCTSDVLFTSIARRDTVTGTIIAVARVVGATKYSCIISPLNP